MNKKDIVLVVMTIFAIIICIVGINVCVHNFFKTRAGKELNTKLDYWFTVPEPNDINSVEKK